MYAQDQTYEDPYVKTWNITLGFSTKNTENIRTELKKSKRKKA